MLSLVPESEGIPPRSVSAPSVSSVASTAPSMSTSVVLPTSPALLATVTNAVQQVASLPACSLPASVADPAGIPVPLATLSQLAAQASSFAASGAGYASSLPATATPTASGRPNNCLVPTFVSTFSTLFRRLLTQPFPALSMQLFPRAPLVPHC